MTAEIDLRDFAYMPLHIARLQKSKAWLECKRAPELAFYLMNLWMRAWHEVPAGSIEDNDDVLADAAMCPMPRWLKIKEKVLRNWLKREDGRLYHVVVSELAADAWNGKWNRPDKQEERSAHARAAAQARWAKREHCPSNADAMPEHSPSNAHAMLGREGNRREEKEKEDKTADAASPPVKKYAFEGGIVKLSEKHFSDWSTAYTNLDLRGELIARDAWLASPKATDEDRRNWFISTSKYLANRNLEGKAKVTAAMPKQTAGGWV